MDRKHAHKTPSTKAAEEKPATRPERPAVKSDRPPPLPRTEPTPGLPVPQPGQPVANTPEGPVPIEVDPRTIPAVPGIPPGNPSPSTPMAPNASPGPHPTPADGTPPRMPR